MRMSGSPQFRMSNSKAAMSSTEDDSGDELIHETETTLDVDDIEIKHEEMDFHLYHSTRDDHSGDHSDLSLQTMSSILHVECGPSKAEEKDWDNFYLDVLLCERNCETCVLYMRMLSEHVRATHDPPEPIQDPLLIDHVPDPLTAQPSSSIQIKSEVDDNIVKMELNCFEEIRAENSASDPDDKIEFDSGRVPGYAPLLLLTRNVRRKGQGLARNHKSSKFTSSKFKQDNLPFKCKECAKSFKCEKYLKVHMRVHSGEKPFKCDMCEKRFARSSNLTEHKRSHTGEKPFKCDVCDKSFSQCTALTKHKRIHTGEKPYQCNVCEMRFRISAHLYDHVRIHTGKKPFQCDLCEKSFARSSNLTVHMISHSEEKTFKCDLCEKSFARSTNLTRHMISHSEEKPFKCDLCEKSFARLYSLTEHKRFHAGEKPFKCVVCEKSFSRQCRLTEHKRVHAEENPFTCDA